VRHIHLTNDGKVPDEVASTIQLKERRSYRQQ
jgi:hypothetical protein